MFKLSLKRPFIIRVNMKKLEVESGHWSDDWEKAEYKIWKYTNDNGYCNYKPYRTLNGETKMASMAAKFGYKSKRKALEAIEDCKKFHKENWNTHYSGKVEWIDVL
jgi:hypothetical protein